MATVEALEAAERRWLELRAPSPRHSALAASALVGIMPFRAVKQHDLKPLAPSVASRSDMPRFLGGSLPATPRAKMSRSLLATPRATTARGLDRVRSTSRASTRAGRLTTATSGISAILRATTASPNGTGFFEALSPLRSPTRVKTATSKDAARPLTGFLGTLAPTASLMDDERLSLSSSRCSSPVGDAPPAAASVLADGMGTARAPTLRADEPSPPELAERSELIGSSAYDSSLYEEVWAPSLSFRPMDSDLDMPSAARAHAAPARAEGGGGGALAKRRWKSPKVERELGKMASLSKEVRHRWQDRVEGILRRMKWFERLPNEQMQTLCGRGLLKLYPRYHYITHEGSLGRHFYILLSGRAQSASAALGLTMRLTEGASFGEGALAADVTRDATVTAIEPCYMLLFSRDDLAGLDVRTDRGRAKMKKLKNGVAGLGLALLRSGS